MAIAHNVEQNGEEWHALRLGIPTASEFSSIITPKTGRLSESSNGYLHWLLAEWIIGAPLETTQTDYMQRGHDLEPMAVSSYEFERDCEVQTVGFVTTDDGMVGASPDRLVNPTGLLEIKCPAPQTHVGYMVGAGVDDKYRTQLQGQLWVCEREWVDIQSYCPGLPTVIVRVARDEDFIGKLSAAVRQFVERLLKAREDLTQKYGPFTRKYDPKPPVDDPLGITDEDVDRILEGHFRRG